MDSDENQNSWQNQDGTTGGDSTQVEVVTYPTGGQTSESSESNTNNTKSSWANQDGTTGGAAGISFSETSTPEGDALPWKDNSSSEDSTDNLESSAESSKGSTSTVSKDASVGTQPVEDKIKTQVVNGDLYIKKEDGWYKYNEKNDVAVGEAMKKYFELQEATTESSLESSSINNNLKLALVDASKFSDWKQTYDTQYKIIKEGSVDMISQMIKGMHRNSEIVSLGRLNFSSSNSWIGKDSDAFKSSFIKWLDIVNRKMDELKKYNKIVEKRAEEQWKSDNEWKGKWL